MTKLKVLYIGSVLLVALTPYADWAYLIIICRVLYLAILYWIPHLAGYDIFEEHRRCENRFRKF